MDDAVGGHGALAGGAVLPEPPGNQQVFQRRETGAQIFVDGERDAETEQAAAHVQSFGRGCEAAAVGAVDAVHHEEAGGAGDGAPSEDGAAGQVHAVTGPSQEEDRQNN